MQLLRAVFYSVRQLNPKTIYFLAGFFIVLPIGYWACVKTAAVDTHQEAMKIQTINKTGRPIAEALSSDALDKVMNHPQ